MADIANNVDAGRPRRFARLRGAVGGLLGRLRPSEDDVDEGNGLPSLFNGRILGDMINAAGVLIAVAAASTLRATGVGLSWYLAFFLCLFALLTITAGVGMLFVRRNSDIQAALDNGNLDSEKLWTYQFCVGFQGLLILVCTGSIIAFVAASDDFAREWLLRVIQIGGIGLAILVFFQVFGQGLNALAAIFVARAAAATLRAKRADGAAAADIKAAKEARLKGRIKACSAVVLGIGLIMIFVSLIMSGVGAFELISNMSEDPSPSNAPDVATIVGSVGWLAVEIAIMIAFWVDRNEGRKFFDGTDRPAPSWREELATFARFVLLGVSLILLIFAAFQNYNFRDVEVYMYLISATAPLGVLIGLVHGVVNIRQKMGSAWEDALEASSDDDASAAPSIHSSHVSARSTASHSGRGRQADRGRRLSQSLESARSRSQSVSSRSSGFFSFGSASRLSATQLRQGYNDGTKSDDEGD